MANITQNGINFNVNDNFLSGESSAGVNGKIRSNNNPYYDLENGDSISKLINAVEIDWNGAVLPNSSTTIGKQITNRIGEIIRWN